MELAWLINARMEFEQKWKHSSSLRKTASDEVPLSSCQIDSCPIDPLADYHILKSLGDGQYNQIIIVQQAQTRENYTLKMLKKDNNVFEEMRILKSISFPFILSYKFHFEDEANLYLMLESCPDQDLLSLLRERGRFPEAMARFYAAQVVLVLEYLHYMDIIYRNLKPGNIFIDCRGFIKLIDFKFAKKVSGGGTWTHCGTPEYMAPELILLKSYDKSVDWWGLGIFIYEMIAGYTPFSACHPVPTFEKIISGDVRFPNYFPRNLRDLLRKLIQVDLSKRYGNLKNGVNDIKNHKWFKTTEWGNLYQKKVPVPFIPKCIAHDDQCKQNDSENTASTSSKHQDANEFADF